MIIFWPPKSWHQGWSLVSWSRCVGLCLSCTRVHEWDVGPKGDVHGMQSKITTAHGQDARLICEVAALLSKLCLGRLSGQEMPIGCKSGRHCSLLTPRGPHQLSQCSHFLFAACLLEARTFFLLQGQALVQELSSNQPHTDAWPKRWKQWVEGQIKGGWMESSMLECLWG